MWDEMNGTPTTGTITGDAVRPGDIELPAQRGSEPPEQQRQAFGRRVRRVRRRRKWSLRELEKRSGVDRGMLSRIEGGKNLTLDVLWRLANGLGVHWADLLDARPADPPDHDMSASFDQQLSAFGALLYEARARQHLSQPELATRTGVSRSTLFTIESGSGNIRLDTLLRLAAGLGVPAADLLDDRHAAAPRPKSRLHEALAELNQLRAELEQTRTQLSLAQARVAIAQRVAQDKAATRLTNAVAQARLVVDRFDRPHLAALSPKQIAAHLDARRMLYDHLDRMWHAGQRRGLDQRPEWSILIALRDLAQYLTSTALDAQLHRN